MVHTFEEMRTRTPANPNEATPEAARPQAAWEALLRDAVGGLRPPPTHPKTLYRWLQTTRSDAWAICAPQAPPPPQYNHTGKEKGTGNRRAREQKGRTHRKGMPQRSDQHRPTPSRHRTNPGGARPPTHATKARTGRRTDRTGSRPPAGGNRAGEGGHTHTGRRGYTHRASRIEHRCAGQHRALTARRRPRPHQGPPQRHQKREGTRPQHLGLGARTPRGHGTKAQPPREGNPADTHLSHQPKTHTRTPRARIQRVTPHLTAPPTHQPATKQRPASRTTTQASLTTTDPTPRTHDGTTRGNTADGTAAHHHATHHDRAPQDTTHHSTTRRDAAQRGTPQHNTAQHGTTKQGAPQHSTDQHGAARRNTAQHSTAHQSRRQHQSKGH